MCNIIGGRHLELLINDKNTERNSKVYTRNSCDYIEYLYQIKHKMFNDGYFQNEEHKKEELVVL